MRVYVAASWRTPRQPEVVAALRNAGHDVYDFRNPAPGNNGFHWSQVGPRWSREAKLPAGEYIETLMSHPRCLEGFAYDMDALQQAHALVLVMPAGRSAHLELGVAIGQQKETVILLEDPIDGPDLMHLAAKHMVGTPAEVVDVLRRAYVPGASLARTSRAPPRNTKLTCTRCKKARKSVATRVARYGGPKICDECAALEAPAVPNPDAKYERDATRRPL